MGLTYRKDKGSALTITELDDNFRHFTGSHSITGSLIVSSSQDVYPTVHVKGMLRVGPHENDPSGAPIFEVVNPSGSVSISGSFGVTGSMNISGSGTVITSGNTGSLGNTTVSGSLTVTGSAIISGSLFVSGSTIYNYGPYHNYHNNVETFTISESFVGINATSPEYDLEILQADGATTASLHVSGAITWVRLQNLPTTPDQAAAFGTGSLFVSGSTQYGVSNYGHKQLFIFTG